MHEMRELLEEANGLLRSAHTIALREGENTNWETFTRSLEKILVKQSKVLNGTNEVVPATVTARTYKKYIDL